MKRSIFMSMALATAAMFAAETGGAAAASEAGAKVSKSVVPAKYAGKYKGGGSGPVPDFIKSQAYENGQIVLESFWSLCRVNDIAEDKVQHYIDLVAEKDSEGKPVNHGAPGKARMTLGNMLAAKARKDGGLKNLSGDFVAIEGLEKPKVSGAAAKAQENATAPDETPAELQENAADPDETPAEPQGDEVDDDGTE